MNEEEFRRPVAPNISFKDYRITGGRRYRGHKGVGLTFLAYGSNYLRLSTRDANGLDHVGELAEGRE